MLFFIFYFDNERTIRDVLYFSNVCPLLFTCDSFVDGVVGDGRSILFGFVPSKGYFVIIYLIFDNSYRFRNTCRLKYTKGKLPGKRKTNKHNLFLAWNNKLDLKKLFITSMEMKRKHI